MTRRYKTAIWTIAAGALCLRLALATAQLPYHYQADEFQVIERALRVGAGELNPGLFTWPGTLVIYLNFLAFAAYFVFARITDAVRDAAAFADLYWQAPGPFYFLGRLISSLFAVGAVATTWRWTRETRGPTAGLVAGVFVALAPAAVKAGAVALPDMAAAALGVAALAVASRYLADPRLRYAVAAGALLGLGAAAKYHILLYAPALIACLALSPGDGRRKTKALMAGAGAGAAAFIVACPFVILEARAFVADLALMARRPGMLRWLPTPAYFLGTTLPLTVGWPFLPLVVVGVLSFLARRNRQALVVALAAAPFIILALVRPLPPRHLLPLVPPLAFAAGAGAEFIIGSRRRALKVGAACLVSLLVAATLGFDLAHVAWARREDTRTAAARYVASEIPAGAAVLVEALPPEVEGPPVWPTKSALKRLIKDYRLFGGGSPGRWAYQLKNPAYPFGRPTYDIYLVTEKLDSGTALVVSYAIRALDYDRDFYAEQGKPYGTPLAPWADNYDEFLRSNGLLIKTLDGRNRPGPTVELYKIR